MKLKDSVFLMMLGDYYLYSFKREHKHTLLANEVASVLVNSINNSHYNINSMFMNYGNTNNLYLGIVDDYGDTITSISGKDISPKKLLLPNGERFFSIEQLPDKMQEIQKKKTFIYYLYSEETSYFDSFFTKTNIDDVDYIFKSIIEPILVLSPHNNFYIQNIISIILSAPISSGEKVVKITDDKIITNLFEYDFVYSKELLSLPKVGDYIEFGLPIYRIGAIKNDLPNNFMFRSILKNRAYNNNLYTNGLIESLIGSYLFLSLDIEVIVDNASKIGLLNRLFREIKVSMVSLSSYKETSEKLQLNPIDSSLYVKTNSVYNMSEDFNLYTNYYHREKEVKAIEAEKILTKDNSKTKVYNADTFTAIRKNSNELKLEEDTKEVVYLDDVVGLEDDNGKMKSKLKDFQLGNFREDTKEYLNISDELKLFRDYFSVIAKDTKKLNVTETTIKNILKLDIDLLGLKEDVMKHKSLLNTIHSTYEGHIFNTALAKSKQIVASFKEKNKLIDVAVSKKSISEIKTISYENDMNIKIFDKIQGKKDFNDNNIIKENSGTKTELVEAVTILDKMIVTDKNTIDTEEE